MERKFDNGMEAEVIPSVADTVGGQAAIAVLTRARGFRWIQKGVPA
jgi:hypothetical protein